MKPLIVFFALCAYVCALPPTLPLRRISEEPIPIVSQESDSGFDGTFVNKYETGNGIAVEQNAVIKTIPVDKEEKVVQEIVGYYSYTAPDGTPIKVEYVANENGFQAHGDVLPVAPSPSPIIARALKFIEEHAPKEEEVKA